MENNNTFLPITNDELLLALSTNSFPFFVGDKYLLRFSLLNKHLHNHWYHFILNCVEFEVFSPQHLKWFRHYHPKRILTKHGDVLHHLPPHLISLSVEQLQFNSFPEFTHQLVCSFPSSLTHLSLRGTMNKKVDCLPATITHLSFGDAFNQPVEHLPYGLTHLSFGNCFNQPLTCLPHKLTNLILGNVFNEPLNDLPYTIQHLIIGSGFSYPLETIRAKFPHILIERKKKDWKPVSLTQLICGPHQ